MRAKYRWFRIKIPKDKMFPEVFSGLPLTKVSSYGFFLKEKLENRVDYRFLQRSQVALTRFDANGDPYYENIENIEFTDFSFLKIKNSAYLRITNPGRIVNGLLNAIETEIGLGFVSRPVEFSKEKPTLLLKYVDAYKLVKLKASEAMFGEDIKARIELSSSHGLDLKKIDFLKDMKYKIDAETFLLTHEGVTGDVTFSATGLTNIGGKLSPLLLNLIESELPHLDKKK